MAPENPIRSAFRFLQDHLPIQSPIVFWAAAGILVGYILYMMVRRRKVERPGHQKPEAL